MKQASAKDKEGISDLELVAYRLMRKYIVTFEMQISGNKYNIFFDSAKLNYWPNSYTVGPILLIDVQSIA